MTGLQPSRKCITRLAKLDEAAFVKRLAGVTRRLAAAECKTLRVTLEHLALQSAAKVRAGEDIPAAPRRKRAQKKSEPAPAPAEEEEEDSE